MIWNPEIPVKTRVFQPPCCRAWVAVGVGAFGIVQGIASKQNQPKAPNVAASAAALSTTNAELLPIQRGLSAAAQTGGEYTFAVPKGIDAGIFQQNLPKGSFTTNPDGTFTVNFKGYGTADVQTAIAKTNAASQLALSQKFDPQYIQSALSQEALADPQSVAAKAEEAKLIQEQASRPLNDPVSEMMNSQIQDSLDAAKNNTLTGVDQARLNAAVASAQGDRGGSGPQADFSAPLTTGFAGEARQTGAAQSADAFLAGGSSPEDIAYRREQQNLGNLSAEASGKTPQSQFGSLSGAQNGPTPIITGQGLPTLPGGQTAAADSAAIQGWGTQMQSQESQVNPWTAGLSSLLGASNLAASAGFKPLAG